MELYGTYYKWKSAEATQTLRAGCSKAETQTNINKHTDRGDYNTLRSLARSVKEHRCYSKN